MIRSPAPRALLRAVCILALVLPLGACAGSGIQDALDPAGPQADRIASFFWFSLALAIAVFVSFVAVLAYGLLRARRRDARGEDNELPFNHGKNLVLWGGLVIPSIILFTLLVYSTYTDRLISRLGRSTSERPVTIEVIGHQFWWEVIYRDEERPYRQFTTANEIHVPAGQPVRFVLHSRDVIHSFWFPNLHGKMDLIPGRTNDLVLQADEPGEFRGQCAEFCGDQHAKMGMVIVAREPDDFSAWWDRQLVPHAPPADPAAAYGQEVFLRNGCALCHTIRGTDAHGTVAPDLSYFGERRTIAAATIPNTRGHLAGWIADPQGIKPGSHMPAVPLRGDELRALLAYLHSLR